MSVSVDRPETSIIIRTRNEERWIGETLARLFAQTYTDFEVIIVDSGSSDATLAIAEGYPVGVVRIPPEAFTYPHALNVGAQHASSTKYLVLLSAHSLPMSPRWLQSAVGHMADPRVMGVYGPLCALPDATLFDHLFHGLSYLREWFLSGSRRYRRIEGDATGVLGFTNALIRKSLWEEHRFDEAFAGGGEDGEWARYWFSRTYYAIKAMDFAVLHSHYLTLAQWREQWKHWTSLSAPMPFHYLPYRKDGAHSPR